MKSMHYFPALLLLNLISLEAMDEKNHPLTSEASAAQQLKKDELDKEKHPAGPENIKVITGTSFIDNKSAAEWAARQKIEIQTPMK